jgi:hypothetical protein
MRLWALVFLGIALFGCSKKDDDDSSDKEKFTLTGSIHAKATDDLRLIEGDLSGSPTSFKVTFFETYLSENKDCSDPVQIDDYGKDGKEVELADGDSIITGEIAAGDYECLILVMSDNLKFKADAEAVADHAGCVSTSTTHVHDVYRAPDEGEEQEGGDYVGIDGKAVEGTGTRASPGEDIITIFATTGDAADVKPEGTAINEFQYFNLEEKLTAPGEAVYYWDATDGIKNSTEDGEDYCVIEEVGSGFR